MDRRDHSAVCDLVDHRAHSGPGHLSAAIRPAPAHRSARSQGRRGGLRPYADSSAHGWIHAFGGGGTRGRPSAHGGGHGAARGGTGTAGAGPGLHARNRSIQHVDLEHGHHADDAAGCRRRPGAGDRTRREADRLRLPLLLGIAYAASIGGLGTPVGTAECGFMGVYKEVTDGSIGLRSGWPRESPWSCAPLPGHGWFADCPAAEPLNLPDRGMDDPERRVLLIGALTALAFARTSRSVDGRPDCAEGVGDADRPHRGGRPRPDPRRPATGDGTRRGCSSGNRPAVSRGDSCCSSAEASRSREPSRPAAWRTPPASFWPKTSASRPGLQRSWWAASPSR